MQSLASSLENTELRWSSSSFILLTLLQTIKTQKDVTWNHVTSSYPKYINCEFIADLHRSGDEHRSLMIPPWQIRCGFILNKVTVLQIAYARHFVVLLLWQQLSLDTYDTFSHILKLAIFSCKLAQLSFADILQRYFFGTVSIIRSPLCHWVYSKWHAPIRSFVKAKNK